MRSIELKMDIDDGDQAQLRKKKEKNKTKEIKAKSQIYKIDFIFGDQDTIESVIMFIINNRTIKRGNLWLSGYRVPLGDMTFAYAFRNLVC
jgi:hypothetical protein